MEGGGPSIGTARKVPSTHTSVQEEFEMPTQVRGCLWFNPSDILVGENLNLSPPTRLSKP